MTRPSLACRQKTGMHDCIVMWKSAIQQVANRDKQIMDPAMAEALLGKQWRGNDNAATKATFELLREKVATELTRIGLTSSGQPLITLVYAAALCSERLIINFLVEHFKDQDDKLQQHNAAAALAHRLVRPRSKNISFVSVQQSSRVEQQHRSTS